MLKRLARFADARMKVASAVVTQVTKALGPPKGHKASALGLAVTEAVVQAMPKNLPARRVAEVLSKVAGPPPEVIHSIVPIGLLGSVAASIPPVSKEVMVQALVNP